MINDVVLEGIVVKAWKYADDLLFRLACYRDQAVIAKAADAAALAAALEINQRVYESNGNLTPTAQTWANAQALANMNNGHMAKYRVNPAVTGIVVDDAKDKVSVQVVRER